MDLRERLAALRRQEETEQARRMSTQERQAEIDRERALKLEEEAHESMLEAQRFARSVLEPLQVEHTLRSASDELKRTGRPQVSAVNGVFTYNEPRPVGSGGIDVDIEYEDNLISTRLNGLLLSWQIPQNLPANWFRRQTKPAFLYVGVAQGGNLEEISLVSAYFDSREQMPNIGRGHNYGGSYNEHFDRRIIKPFTKKEFLEDKPYANPESVEVVREQLDTSLLDIITKNGLLR